MAFALLGLTAPLHSVWFVLIPLVTLMGLGMGLVVSPLSTAVMTSVDDGDTGIASGVNNAVARVAGLVAVALLGAVVAACSSERWAARPNCRSFLAAAGGPCRQTTEAARRGGDRRCLRRDLPMSPRRWRWFPAAIAWLTLERQGLASCASWRGDGDGRRVAGHQVADLGHRLARTASSYCSAALVLGQLDAQRIDQVAVDLDLEMQVRCRSTGRSSRHSR